MNSRKLKLMIIIMVAALNAVAQTGAVKGRIITDEGPAIWASVALLSTDFGTNTDEEGRFLLQEIPTGHYELAISLLGYQRLVKKIVVAAEEVLNLEDILLREDIFGLQEVVVTGTMKETFVANSPIKIDVITAKYLEKNTSPTNLMEGISLVNGVQEVVACGVCYTNSISINGLPGPYTAVLMDGAPIYGNLASVYGLNGIPTTIIDRFEVIKGPSSTLYGSEAVAGVINIITKDPAKQALVSFDLMGTSHLESFGSLGIAPKLGRFNGFIGLNYAYINDYEDFNQDNFGDMVNLDRVSLFSKWSMTRKSKKRLTVAGKYYYEDRRNGVELFLKDRAYRELRGSDEFYGESIYTNRLELFGTYEFPFEEKIKLDYSLSHHLQDSYYGADYYEAEQSILFANLTWNKLLGKHDLLLGWTTRWQSYDDNTIATPEADKQFIPGVFLQDEWHLHDQVSLLGGLRLDHYKAHGLILSPRLNVKYNPGTWSTVRLNFGTGFRVVNLFAEDHAFVTGQRSVEIEGHLEPERSYNGSLNFNHIFVLGEGQGSFDIDAFYTYFTNKIIPDYDTPGKIIYANSEGHAISQGIGLNLNYQFRFPLGFNAGFNLQEVTQTEPDEFGNSHTSAIEYSPSWSGIATINYEWKKPALSFAYTLRLTGPMALPEVFDLDENGDPLGAARPTSSTPFSFHNIQITKAFKKQGLQIYAGIANLFNYRQRESPLVGYNDPNVAPGFSDYFDTAYAYSPLHGREFYVGVKWKSGKK